MKYLGPDINLQTHRVKAGNKGKEYAYLDEVCFTAENMCGRFMKDMDKAFEMWKPRKRYEIRGV